MHGRKNALWSWLVRVGALALLSRVQQPWVVPLTSLCLDLHTISFLNWRIIAVLCCVGFCRPAS